MPKRGFDVSWFDNNSGVGESATAAAGFEVSQIETPTIAIKLALMSEKSFTKLNS
jgi:hypothetical protein